MTTSGLGATNHDTRKTAHRAGAPAEHYPLTRRDLSFIVGFWLIYALLTIANHAFDPGPPDRRADGTLTIWVFIALAEVALWALLTPLIVSIAGRARSERMSRGMNYLLLALVGVVI
ncbi:MAG: hypothetical protein ACHQRL_09985, partial [Gemmatimonadales bacterium]